MDGLDYFEAAVDEEGEGPVAWDGAGVASADFAGRYSGPRWPQAATVVNNRMKIAVRMK